MRSFGQKFWAVIKENPVLWSVAAFMLLAVGTVALVLALSPVAPGIVQTSPPPIISSAPSPSPGESPVSILSVETVGKQTGRGIAQDTAFLIKTDRELPEEQLGAGFTLEPAVEFSVVKTAPTSYTLTPATLLPQDTVVRLTYNGGNEDTYRWAFQTGGEFRVISVLPADMGQYVPVETGIEITFSHADFELDALEQYFSIEPAVAGSFEKYGATAVFVPHRALNYEAGYAVTLKAGFSARTGEKTAADTVFRFRTQEVWRSSWCYFTGNVSETFLPDDPALLELYASKEYLSRSFAVKLYAYPNTETAVQTLEAYAAQESWAGDYLFPTASLSLVSDTTQPLLGEGENSGYYWTAYYLTLPDGLAEGVYLADVRADGPEGPVHLQKIVQISSLSVFAVNLSRESAFFVNDTTTGTALPGATISLSWDDRRQTAVTAADGTVIVETGADSYTDGVLTIRSGDRAYVDLYSLARTDPQDLSHLYYTYVYTDRAAYLSSDTVRVWGVVRPREKGGAVPPNLTLTLGYSEENRIVQPVTPGADGSFSAAFSFEHRVEGYVPLTLKSNGEDLFYSYVNICDYVKPAYQVSVSVPDFAFLNDSVTADVQVSYFDGAPGAGIPFTLYSGDIIGQGELSANTNTAGKASFHFRITDADTWRPRYVSLHFSNSGIENEVQSQYGGLYYLPRDTMMTAKTLSDDTVEVRVNRVTTANITDRADLSYEYEDLLRGAAADIPVTAQLWRVYYEEVETGTRYDFLQKKNVTTYRYDHHEEILGIYDATAQNGVCVFDGLPTGEENSYYYIELSCQDSRGKPVAERFSVNAEMYGYYDSDRHYYTLETPGYRFAEDETLPFQLCDNSVPVTEGRIFYTLSRSEFIRTETVSRTDPSIAFPAEMIPNVRLCGAYFDGRHVYPIEGKNLYFDPAVRALTVTVEADKPSYGPGEKARVTVTVKDQAGRALPDAAVSLSVVDEAAFAVAEQWVDPLAELYRALPTDFVELYSSHTQHGGTGTGGAEGGEGGEDNSLRQDFRDTAAFLTAATDSQGRASFTFDLPDNLTTWRLTAQAIGEDTTAGDTRGSLVVTRPFFVLPIALASYVDGDDITVSARAVGASDAQLSAQLTGEGFDKTLTGSSGGAFAFGKLPAGEYTLTLTAQSGQQRDSIQQPLTVVSSALETAVSRSFDLAGGLPIQPVRYPVTLSFYNTEYKTYGAALSYLCQAAGDRADTRVGRAAAARLLELDENIYLSDGLEDLAQGGISLLSYAQNDPELTALVCAASPEVVSKTRAAEYLRDILADRSSTAGQVSAAYLGLAALSEPVLLDIRDLLNDPQGLILADKLRLTAGLALLGDYDGARTWYDTLVSPLLTSEQRPLTGSRWQYLTGADLETQLAHTATALLTASVLSLPEADRMAAFLMENPSALRSPALELTVYVTRFTPKSPQGATFSYKLDGRLVNVNLAKTRMTTLSFGREQLDAADFTVTSGAVTCTAYYIGDATQWTGAPTLTVFKSVAPVSGGFSAGGLLKVTLTPVLTSDLPAGLYTLEDAIPSGARFVGADPQHSVSRSGQRVSTHLYFNPKSGTPVEPVVYYIRCVTPGQYVQEGAILHSQTGLWGKAEDSTLVIEP